MSTNYRDRRPPMLSQRPSVIQRILLAVGPPALAVGATLAIRYFFDFSLNPTPFVLVAVALSAWYGGRIAGVVAALLLDIAIDYFFETPLYQFTPSSAHFVRFGILALVALLISARKRTETALREQREWLRTTLSSIGDAVIATDRDGAIAFMNPVASSLTGWSSDEATGRPLRDVFQILDEETRGEVESPVERVIREGSVVGLANHTVLVARDGREIPIEDSGAPITDASGAVIGVVLVFHDVTERRRAEAALHNQRRWLQEVLDLAPTPILFVEPGTGKITFANRAADELAGGSFPTGEVANRYGDQIAFSTADGEPLTVDELPSMRLARGERLDGVEIAWRSSRGLQSVLAHADTLPEMHGHPPTGILVFNDVTALKKIEAELRDASQLKDEFLATVSHELRTPLTPIIGWIAMLRGGLSDPATVERALDTIARNVRSQEQIIDDLLDVSRIISGKLRFEPSAVDLGEIVTSAVETVQPAAAAKGIGFETKVSPGLVVFGDPDRLRQVVWNLLSNAVKFTPDGGRVDVELAASEDGIRLEVCDTGQGIPSAFLPYVFDRFRQADSSTTRRHGGLGLGLSIVRHLVEMHGGKVRAESGGEGCGAKFVVTLPPLKAGFTKVNRVEDGVQNP
jgi:PAS domain S-box-containing protein